jgi:hypothetical protein
MKFAVNKRARFIFKKIAYITAVDIYYVNVNIKQQELAELHVE